VEDLPKMTKHGLLAMETTEKSKRDTTGAEKNMRCVESSTEEQARNAQNKNLRERKPIRFLGECSRTKETQVIGHTQGEE
jgi:hypothetical protein